MHKPEWARVGLSLSSYLDPAGVGREQPFTKLVTSTNLSLVSAAPATGGRLFIKSICCPGSSTLLPSRMSAVSAGHHKMLITMVWNMCSSKVIRKIIHNYLKISNSTTTPLFNPDNLTNVTYTHDKIPAS